MASTKSSRVNPKYKKKYRVGNWRAYERGLRARGDVTIWFAEDALSTWTPPPTRCRGGQPRYSNLAILTALTLRMLFHLPLRQTEGFVASAGHLAVLVPILAGGAGSIVHFAWCRRNGIHPLHATPRRRVLRTAAVRQWSWLEE